MVISLGSVTPEGKSNGHTSLAGVGTGANPEAVCGVQKYGDPDRDAKYARKRVFIVVRSILAPGHERPAGGIPIP